MANFNTDLVKTIQTQSLSSVICSQLEEMILSGDILPGERINESQLSSTLGVSRAPIREACRQLERSGMVEVRINKGTFVKEIDLQEVEELYEIRATLDALAADKAAQIITEDQKTALHIHLEEMQQAAQQDDHQHYFKANIGFHMCIMHIAGNKNLLEIYEGVSKKASLFRKTSLSAPGRLPVSLKQHEAIYDAIASGDADKAADLMKHHIHDAKTIILESGVTSDD